MQKRSLNMFMFTAQPFHPSGIHSSRFRPQKRAAPQRQRAVQIVFPPRAGCPQKYAVFLLFIAGGGKPRMHARSETLLFQSCVHARSAATSKCPESPHFSVSRFFFHYSIRKMNINSLIPSLFSQRIAFSFIYTGIHFDNSIKI